MNMLVFPVRSSMKSNRDSVLAEEAPSRTQGTTNSLVSMKIRFVMTKIAVP